ncbi:MAG: hypothetical protein V4582_24520 [Pseudomonadota bacterium]
MVKLLLNLLVFSVGFAWFAARNHQAITVALAHRIALTGVALLALVAAFGTLMSHKPLAAVFLSLDNSNDHQMGVVYGVAALYIALLCYVWSLSRYLQTRSGATRKGKR